MTPEMLLAECQTRLAESQDLLRRLLESNEPTDAGHVGPANMEVQGLKTAEWWLRRLMPPAVEIDVTEACQNLQHKLKGFTIRLDLSDYWYSGLEAIDLCRKYGLPEGTPIRTKGSTQFAIEDEGFIRAWFPSDQTRQSATVLLDWLMPSEVCLHGQDIDLIASPGFTMERVKELFVRAKFATLEAKLALADKEIELNKEDDEEEDD